MAEYHLLPILLSEPIGPPERKYFRHVFSLLARTSLGGCAAVQIILLIRLLN
jgi:hypothetical protein